MQLEEVEQQGEQGRTRRRTSGESSRRTRGGGVAGERGRGRGRGLQRKSVCRSSSPLCFSEQRWASNSKRQGERERRRKQLLREQLQSRAAAERDGAAASTTR